ncbi:SDR family NAD(P)-dependent oxidoreductase [Microbacterium sp. STN6]|uniref:SDR family NAD(P)-dependent oxidoreductase n=1 Tax=Microbacterium sp. STN6 TaxID=2995588 RepID=UPI002260C76B|nr:SDR family NAD(P)-dependent oxidoreductase [Microbacterium sp. STN6]MCX7522925.1 SDR family NAD(P)-dependent oxidoreductase [Microbacterium sp. STN6]
MSRTVSGATVLVTGAASGMGLLYAERAVAEGARAVILWDVDGRGLAAAVERLGDAAAAAHPAGNPTRIASYRVDLAEPGAIAQTAQKVRQEFGSPDVLINNAGIVRSGFFWQHDSGEHIRRIMQVNALAPMYITREFLPGMINGTRSGPNSTSNRAPRAARIVNIASAAGTLANPRMSVYAASKWSLIGWSESLRLELEQQGHDHVKVTTVMPSYISTGMFAGARGPLLTPILTPEYVVGRVWRAMLAGRPTLALPWSVNLAKALRGILPTRAWDALADRVFGVYHSMDDFTGR